MGVIQLVVCGVMCDCIRMSASLPHSLIILYHRIFHKRFSAFGNIICGRLDVLLALSGVPAAKDVGACCLPALHRWNAIMCSTCCTSDFKFESARHCPMMRSRKWRFRAKRTWWRICKSIIAFDVCALLSTVGLSPPPLLAPTSLDRQYMMLVLLETRWFSPLISLSKVWVESMV